MKHIGITLMNLLLAFTIYAMQRPQFTESVTFTVALAEGDSADTDIECCDYSNPTSSKEDEPEKAKTAAAIKKLKSGIVGNWENTVYPFEVNEAGIIPGAFFKYSFHKSGQYTKIVGNAELEIKEKGQWSISADGNYLIMEASNGNVSEAMIKHLQLDELVLEHELKVKDAAFCTKQKDFFFNKQ